MQINHIFKRKPINNIKEISMKLLNNETISKKLLYESKFSPSHGAINGFLGTGILYYSIPYMLKARQCLCLGSGDGFVPRLMRQAQKDLELKDSKTTLIDANKPEAGWGKPDYFEDRNCFFRTEYPEIEIINKTTDDAFNDVKKNKYDYIHIDADHSYEYTKKDFENYSRLMSDNSCLTMHDTNKDWSKDGVSKVIEEIRKTGIFDVVDFNNLWHGVAIIKKTVKK